VSFKDCAEQHWHSPRSSSKTATAQAAGSTPHQKGDGSIHSGEDNNLTSGASGSCFDFEEAQSKRLGSRQFEIILTAQQYVDTLLATIPSVSISYRSGVLVDSNPISRSSIALV